MAVVVDGMGKAGSTLARYLDENGDFVSYDQEQPPQTQAPTDTSPGPNASDYTNPDTAQPTGGYTSPGTAASSPYQAPTPTPAAAFSGGGGPPLPNDPYYAQYQQEHNLTGPAAVGPQVTYQNQPYVAPKATTGTGAGTGSPLRAIFEKYGLDPDNPGHGLANVDYFAQGGGGHANPGDIDYWTRRTEQEIRKALFGEQGDLIDTGGAGARAGAGFGGPQAAPFDLGSYTQQLLSSFQNWNRNPYLDSIRQIIMDRLGKAQGPVNEQEAGITQAVTGARDEATRAQEKERAQLAESLYAQGGLNTEAVPRYIQQSGERTATALGSLRANLVMGAYRQKQQELQQLLSLAAQSGDAESARQIQTQMAALDAALREEGFGVDLAKTQAYLNQQTALAGLNG